MTAPIEATNARINRARQLEERVLRLLDDLQASRDLDQRWLAIGRTDIEKGFWAVHRAILKPGRVALLTDDRE